MAIQLRCIKILIHGMCEKKRLMKKNQIFIVHEIFGGALLVSMLVLNKMGQVKRIEDLYWLLRDLVVMFVWLYLSQPPKRKNHII